MPAFQGSDSFPPGNRPPCDTSLTNTIGSTHDRRHTTIGVPHDAGPSNAAPNDPTMTPLPSRAIRFPMADGFSPSFRATSFPSGNRSPPEVCPPQDYRVDLSQSASDPPVLVGPVESPCPSDKERLAGLRQVGLFDIWGLATAKYHGGDLGVRVLTVQFIHECGYRSFSNTMSPEDVLLSFGEIIQVHRKVKQGWYNTRNQTSGLSVKRILDQGLAVFPKLRSLDVHDAVDFYDKLQELSAAYLLPLMPSDAICLEFNFEGLCIPGLGVDRYAECASALMEILPRLLLTS